MKLYYIFLLLLVASISQAQIVNIPDANFKNALVNENVVDIDGDEIGDISVDTNNDGEIQVSEAEVVEHLIVSYFEISSLTGIEEFSNLITLWCDNNLLQNLNISYNTNLNSLYCNDNNIIELDVTQNPNLGFLLCYRNLLTELDVSQNSNLIHLNFKQNSIAEINVSQNLNLSTLRCSFNGISELDLSQNLGLTTLDCGGNNLTDIDLSQNSHLTFFTCAANNLVEIDLSQNPELYWFMCHINESLENLYLNNGTNTTLSLMWAHDTPNLHCIIVDNKDYANSKECGYPTSGWCIDEFDQFIEINEECVLSIEETNKVDFKVYPNPTQDFLFIESQELIETVKIFNLQGQLIKEVTSNRIDVSALSTGLYFAQVTVNGNSETKKFIKN